MVSRNKIIKTVIICLLLSVLFSGCIEEKKIVQAPDSIQKDAVEVSSPNLTQSSKEENIPEIKITSFSSVYLHDNSNNEVIYLRWETVPNESNRLLSYLKNDLHIEWVTNAQIIRDDVNKTIHVFTNERSIEIVPYDKIYQTKYDISERYYAAYNLSIKNNGSNPIDFKMNDLRLHEGDRKFNVTLEPYWLVSLGLLEVLRDLDTENEIHDRTLLPGQSLNGTVVFRVNSLYNESFLLVYNKTPVTSASYEKSIEALRTAEKFNYSVALGVPPYCKCNELGGMKGSYEPIFNNNCDTWANWVNRSIFETFQKSDQDNMPTTEMVYALRVFPEKNISMFPLKTEFYFATPLVIDDTGVEIINTSRGIAVLAVFSNRTYTLFKYGEKLNMPRMKFSSASVVQISFEGTFGEPMGQGRSFVNQIIILDNELNIIAVSYDPVQFES